MAEVLLNPLYQNINNKKDAIIHAFVIGHVLVSIPNENSLVHVPRLAFHICHMEEIDPDALLLLLIIMNSNLNFPWPLALPSAAELFHTLLISYHQ